MATVTLLAKAYNSSQTKFLDKFLKSTIKGLRVETKIGEITARGWVQIVVHGEDEKVALRYLAEHVGLCPTSLEHVEKFLEIKGRITNLNKSKSELFVDIGIFSPNIVDVAVRLQGLQAQLADGRKVALKKLMELFGFCENLPLSVKIFKVEKENNCIEAVLSEKQLTQYREWMKSLLDRLIILGASHDEIKFALRAAWCNRDIVNIKPLGLFEHSVTCKLGTDAAGLVPKIGKNLRNATFSIFNPREILRFLGESFIF